MFAIYWISMYLVVFAVVYNVLTWWFKKKNFTGKTSETVALLLAFVWLFWLEAALIVGGIWLIYKVVTAPLKIGKYIREGVQGAA